MAAKSSKKIKKIVLAYSGGLDTSVIIPWLKENYTGAEVIAYAADLGQAEELDGLVEKGKKTGAVEVIIDDLREEFVTDFLFPMIKAGAVYEGSYLLGTSIARPLIAQKQVEVARKFKADAVAHGATGKGNDQVRFELTYKALAPDLYIIAPWREWDMESREDEIEYAKAHGIPVPTTKKEPYSRDRNLWHMSHEGGVLENPANQAPESLFVLTRDPRKAPAKGAVVALEFKNGVPVGVNGKKFKPLELVMELNRIGGEHGVGRIDIVENRLVGIKSRGVYETPGGAIIMAAHKDLESITLDRDTLHYKEMVALKYAELVYNGQWFCPLRQALDAFVDSTQQNVEGTVTMELRQGGIRVLSRESRKSLYLEDLATFEGGGWYDQTDAGGFINLFGLQMKVNALKHGGGKAGGGKRRKK